jgi:hypothetical protein
MKRSGREMDSPRYELHRFEYLVAARRAFGSCGALRMSELVVRLFFRYVSPPVRSKVDQRC